MLSQVVLQFLFQLAFDNALTGHVRVSFVTLLFDLHMISCTGACAMVTVNHNVCTGAIVCTCECKYVHFKSQPTTSVVWVYRETHIDKQKERRTAHNCDESIPVHQLSVSCWSS